MNRKRKYGNIINNEGVKLDKVYSEYKVKCKCGHSIFFPVQVSKMICSWCNNIVYNTNELGQRQRFKDEFKKAKGRIERNENNKSSTI